MKKTINDYKAMLEELRNLGNDLIDAAYNDEDDNFPEWVDEVECMAMHIECALGILKNIKA